MSREVPLTTTGRLGGGERTHTINRLVQIGPVSFRVLTIASLASLLLFYLAQTTQSATKSYEVQSLEQSAQELREDAERLELEAKRLQSLGAIQQGLGAKLENDFEPAKDLKSVE
ncbi:hypothetical protein HY374_04095 [Candidatus Berkelbacteria bacterium]|nr:hypothetical protein [Candidatus Berkelbacteria bacterium]